MALNSFGDLILSARTNPNASSTGSYCRALVDLGRQLVINYENDFSAGLRVDGPVSFTGNLIRIAGQAQLTRNLVDNENSGFSLRLGSSKPCWGLVARVGRTTSSLPGANFAALAGVSDIDGVYGVYARARNGTHALLVRGTAQFTGAKTGYVVDKFINASGKRLIMGDVVKLKGNSIHHFYGDDNKIPVPEVVLADVDDDNCVIGIVDRESIPDQDETDTRVHPEDPTFVEDGGELFVVTLGTYAHCKVDATHTPIAVGDLLTSSTNPGHAQKATNPTTGSIIGKALESLQEGVGHIAVFVNIQ